MTAAKPPCKVEGCTAPQRGRGWCAAHYSRWHRHGDPLAERGRALKGKPSQWMKWATEQQTDECIEYPFTKDRKGYGRLHDLDAKTTALATHYALRLVSVDRPSSEHMALHSCDNPPCVNPRHLRWGTAAENTADMMRRGRSRRPAAKLTDGDVQEIRRLRGVLAGRDIAKRFGVSPATVSEIQLHRKRKDVA